MLAGLTAIDILRDAATGVAGPDRINEEVFCVCIFHRFCGDVEWADASRAVPAARHLHAAALLSAATCRHCCQFWDFPEFPVFPAERLVGPPQPHPYPEVLAPARPPPWRGADRDE